MACRDYFRCSPAGAPGLALLVIRLSIAVMLLLLAYPGTQLRLPAWELALFALLALSLCVGMFTPISAFFCAVANLQASSQLHGVESIYLVFSALIAAALSILGPGAFSLDALMFGRRLIAPPK